MPDLTAAQRAELAEALINGRCECGHYPGAHHLDTGCHGVTQPPMFEHCPCERDMPEAEAAAIGPLIAHWLTEAADAREAEVRARVEPVLAILSRFDCIEDHIPPHIDVPDDYESGVHYAAELVSAALSAAETPGDDGEGT